MASARPPPPQYSSPLPSSSTPLPSSPPPPYKPPLPDRPENVQRAPQQYKPPLPTRPENVQRAVVVPEHRQGEIQHAVVVPETYNQSAAVQQAARVDGGDAESPPPPQQVAATRDGHDRTMSAGEHRAEHGEGRMRLRSRSWALQLGVWALFVGLFISIGHLRAVFAILLLLALVTYFDMCKDAGTREFVSNLDREVNVQQYVQQLRTTIPVLRFDAECYHAETRTRQVADTSTNANGQTTTTYRTELYVVNVTTHQASEDYSFTRWEDATAVLSGTDSVELTKLHLSKELGFLTDDGETQMLAAYNAFCAAHNFDVLQSYRKDLRITNFKERILCLSNVGQVPWWVSTLWYWVASVLLMNLPYRQYLDWITGIIRHTITKKIA